MKCVRYLFSAVDRLQKRIPVEVRTFELPAMKNGDEHRNGAAILRLHEEERRYLESPRLINAAREVASPKGTPSTDYCSGVRLCCLRH